MGVRAVPTGANSSTTTTVAAGVDVAMLSLPWSRGAPLSIDRRAKGAVRQQVAPLLLVLVAAAVVGAGCDRAVPTITARVDRMDADRVWLVPEVPDWDDVTDCYGVRFQQGSLPELRVKWVSAIVVDPADPTKRDAPLREVEVLHRACRR